jgi:ribosomal protein S18 acetylase RimI-like enzyme
MTLAPVGERTDALSLVPHLLPWVHAAGNPYFDWLFGSAARARDVLATWMARSTSEVAVTGVTALYVGEAAAGGYVAWPSEEVTERRWADAQALFKAFSGPERQALRLRLSAAATLFVPPEPASYYLSKVGVLAPYRGRGHGRRLVERYLEEGARLGHQSFSLDVSADNAAAVRLYQALGFVELASRTSADGRLTYVRLCLTTEPDASGPPPAGSDGETVAGAPTAPWPSDVEAAARAAARFASPPSL